MHRGRVLIVDDEKHLRRILKTLLEEEGYMVDVASTGLAAITKAKQNSYNLIVTDLRLPGISGQETIKKMEEIDPDMKFIIISGYQLDSETEAKIKRGLCAFFEKPFLNEDIVSEVRRLIG